MNRKKSIVISITAIVIIILFFIGLTYAYFVTQIQGNESDKSLEVTTANLLLTYGDGNGSITAENLMPGTVIDTKTFTVINNGNNVVNNYAVYFENLENTFTNTNDVRYTLTCKSSDSNYCKGSEGSFPTTNDIIVKNSIDVGVIHTYELKVEYLETGTDQSIDMGKVLKAKIQIYDSRNIVDITGTITGYSAGDYVEIQSMPKTSLIDNEGTYKLTAVEPGTHTIYVKDMENNILGKKTIVVNKQGTEYIEGTTINIIDTSQTVIANIPSINTELPINITTIKSYNIFKEGTLASEIYKNAILQNNGTTLTDIPMTKPGKRATFFSEKGPFNADIPSNVQNQYITYGTGYKKNSNGTFDLTGVETCIFKDCLETLNTGEKYLVANHASSFFSNVNTPKKFTGISALIKIREATLSNISYTSKNSDLEERELSVIEDNYGDSYYFRGDVENNYLTFANKCWRIVRINGDGSIKILLEDNSNQCSSDMNGVGHIGKYPFGYTREYVLKNGVLKSQQRMNYINLENEFMYKKLHDYEMTLNDYKTYLAPNNMCYEKVSENSNIVDESTLITEYYEKWQYIRYPSFKRLIWGTTPTLKCDGDILTKWNGTNDDIYISALTASEVVFAGANYNFINQGMYLNKKDYSMWTISPSCWDNISGLFLSFNLYFFGELGGNTITNGNSIRPVVILKAETLFKSGDGTINNSYRIE